MSETYRHWDQLPMGVTSERERAAGLGVAWISSLIDVSPPRPLSPVMVKINTGTSTEHQFGHFHLQMLGAIYLTLQVLVPMTGENKDGHCENKRTICA